MKDLELKTPPHNQDSEEAVLGSLLIDGELIKIVRVEPADFYYPQNGTIFQAMLDLKEKGTAINEITVAQKLHEQGKLKECGGAAQLAHLVSICPTSLDCEYYADIVKRLAISRGLVMVSAQIAALGYEASEDVTASISKADDLLLKLRQNAGGTTIVTPKDRTQLLIDRYSGLHDNNGGIALSTGLTDIDNMIGGGFFPGELTILAAAASVGKTSLAQAISNYIATENNVLFFIGEMGCEDMSDRDVAGILHLKTDTIRRGGFGFETLCNILDKAIPRISELKVHYVASSTNFKFDTGHIYQEAYGMSLRQGLGLIVIDSLGLLADNKGNNRNEILGNATRNLKMMGRDLGVPILLLHHISRDLTKRNDKRPELYDLYESGHIEQNADNVIFMYRDDYYYRTPEAWQKAFPGQDYPQNIVEIILAKHRQGKTALTKVLWQDKSQSYVNLAKEPERLL